MKSILLNIERLGIILRIISKEKDYYDSVQSISQEAEPLYVRDAKEVKLEKFPFPLVSNCFESIQGFEYVVGFCGKVYPIFLLRHLVQDYRKNFVSGFIDKYCFNPQDVYEYVAEHLTKKQLNRFYEKKKNRFSSPFYAQYYDFSEKGIEAYFKKMEEIKNSFNNIFEENKCPIFLAVNNSRYDAKITYNSVLKNVEFFKVFDPFTAYQELRMYLSNIAVPMKEIPKMDDATSIALHGFDKFSFRKVSSKVKK